MSDKETSMATAGLTCTALGIVPLLGFVFGTAGIVFSVIALKRHYTDPDAYGGEKRAVFAVILWGALVAAWTWALVYRPETILG